MRILNPLLVILDFTQNTTLDLHWDEKVILIAQFAKVVLQLSPKQIDLSVPPVINRICLPESQVNMHMMHLISLGLNIKA